METKLDSKDLKIISALKDDSRLPIRGISKKTGIRPSTVHQRIARLRKENIIEKFTLKLNNKLVGENFIVFMLVKTKPAAILGNSIIGNSHVKEIFGVTGEYDLIIKLKFRDVEEFNDFVLRFRKEQKIETTLTMIATADVKEEI
ncbi:Lrp/AsnC family transcriptional regulator [Candidatus Woesearchaeota archaeon]|nr:Lrp/AsnC family transcriptional regulator [Candidatus Woesearchaeota archaeon]